MLRAVLVSLALVLANAAAAQEMVAPRIDLAALNVASGKRFSRIEASAVPVLLPFDAEALRKAAEPADADKFVLGGFTASKFFQAGPAGYDAVFTLRASETAEFSDIAYPEPVYILLTGLRFTYRIDGPLPEAAPVRELEAVYPSVRRVWHEFVQRTIFEGYGATYVVAINCRDIAPTGRILSCPQAARIADKFVRSLRLVGGTPPAEPIAPVALQRPEAQSPDFTFHPPGALIPQTGRRPELGGRVDRTVYANLRFQTPTRPLLPIRSRSTIGATTISPAACHARCTARTRRMPAR